MRHGADVTSWVLVSVTDSRDSVPAGLGPVPLPYAEAVPRRRRHQLRGPERGEAAELPNPASRECHWAVRPVVSPPCLSQQRYWRETSTVPLVNASPLKYIWRAARPSTCTPGP